MKRVRLLALLCSLGLAACGPRPTRNTPTPTPALATIPAALPTTLAAFRLPPAATLTPLPPPPTPPARAPYPAPTLPSIPSPSPAPALSPGASPVPGVAPLTLSLNFNCIANCGRRAGNYIVRLMLTASGGVLPFTFTPGPTFDVEIPHCTDGRGVASVTSADGQTAQQDWTYTDVACP
jgi:hypothetical protein